MSENKPHNHEHEEQPGQTAVNTVGGAIVGFLAGMAVRDSFARFSQLVKQNVGRVQDMAVQAGDPGVADDALAAIVGQQHLPIAKELADNARKAWHMQTPDRKGAINAMETSVGRLEDALLSERMIGRIPGGAFTILAASTALGAVIAYMGYKMLYGKEERNASVPQGLLEKIEAEQRTPGGSAVRER